MNWRPLILVPILLVPFAASSTTVNYCNDPAVEREWSELLVKYRDIPEWRDINQYRKRLCRQVNSGDLTIDEAIDLFERVRTKKIEHLRKRLERREQTETQQYYGSQLG